MGRGAQQDEILCDDSAVWNQSWGKEEGTIRLAFQNANKLGFDEEQIKQRIFDFLNKYNIDKLGIAEINTFWPKMKKDQRL